MSINNGPTFERSRFPFILSGASLLVALAMFAIPRVPQIAAMRTPHSHHWQVEKSLACETAHYVDDVTHKEVGYIFHCGEGSTWEASSFEGWNYFIRESYDTKERAVRRIEQYIQ